MTGILNALIAGVSGAVKDAYFNLVSLLLPGNGTNGAQNNTFLDSSTNNFTITRNGNTTQGTFSPFSQTGWGSYFNGSSNLQLSSNADFQPGTGNFTIEAWVNFSANNSMIVAVFNQGCAFYVKSTGFLAFAQDSVAERLVASTAFPLNQWNHVAVVRSSTTLTIYQNGVSVGSVSNSDNLTGTTVTVGSGNALSQGSTGYISNFRFVKNQALFTGAFTPAIAPINSTAVGSTGAGVPTQSITGTVALLTCQSNRFVDNSPTPKTITTGGSPSVVAFSPFAPTAAYTTAAVGGSGYFDGTGDYLSVANNAAFNFGSGAFTIELWYYPTTLSGTQCLITNYGGSTTGFVVQMGGSTAGSGKIDAGFSGDGADITSTNTVQLNSWNHIAISGTPGATGIKLFINGNQEGSTYTGATSLDTSAALLIGEVASTNRLSGYLSGLRLLKGTALYTTSTYTVPTAPLTAITNTSLLLNYTNAGITDATAKNDLETVGNAQIVSPTPSKFGGGSIAFDGTGDTLSIPASPINTFGTGDFTIEAWINISSNAANSMIVSNGSWGANKWSIQTNHSTQVNKLSFWVNNISASAVLASTTTLITGTWYYIALTRSGTTLKLFVNGTQEASTTSSVSIDGGVAYINYVGSDGTTASTFFNGYIDDLRITKGYARIITASPTAPFPVQ